MKGNSGHLAKSARYPCTCSLKLFFTCVSFHPSFCFFHCFVSVFLTCVYFLPLASILTLLFNAESLSSSLVSPCVHFHSVSSLSVSASFRLYLLVYMFTCFLCLLAPFFRCFYVYFCLDSVLIIVEKFPTSLFYSPLLLPPLDLSINFV